MIQAGRYLMRTDNASSTSRRMDSLKKTALGENQRAPSRTRSASGQRRASNRAVNGLLVLDKPSGPTSNGVLQRVKRMYQARKAGHTGSLDPLASGMLPLCFGSATKLSAYLLGADKEYRVTAAFGSKTDTADADGRIVAESPVKAIDRDTLLAVLGKFRGRIEQIPPMYSALKQDGRRLYELARRGEEVPRAPRRVEIHNLELEIFDPQHPVLRVCCSKGTYIRTLVEEIAAAAGTHGHVAALRRLRVSPFSEEDLIGLDELEVAAADGLEALDRLLLPADRAIGDWPAVYLDQQKSLKWLHGQPLTGFGESDPGLVRVYDSGSGFLGIGAVLADGRLVPKRVFAELVDSAE
jgi:tRNA pseudouridine55 synthase